MLRIPNRSASQFKPTKAGPKKAAPQRAATANVPVGASQPAISTPSSTAPAETQASSQPISLPPSIPQSSALPPPALASPNPTPPTSQTPGPPTIASHNAATQSPVFALPAEKPPSLAAPSASKASSSSRPPPSPSLGPSRQPSHAPSFREPASRAASVPRSGRLSLIEAAAVHTSTGPSPGRLPPKTSSSATATDYGLPPTLAASSLPIDPVLLASSSRATSVRPAASRSFTPIVQTPGSNDPATIAEALVASIRALPGSETHVTYANQRRGANRAGFQPPRKRKNPSGVDGQVNGDAENLSATGRMEPTAKRRKGAVPGRIRRRRPKLGDDFQEEVIDEGTAEDLEDAEALRFARRRGPYSSRGTAGTTHDKRLRANAHRRKQPAKPRKSHPELEGVQADEMVGMDVNPNSTLMGDLATKLMSEGKVSSRGVRMHAFQRSEEERKRVERAERAEVSWKRKQIQRRKLRAMKNADRELRRQDVGVRSDEEITADSEDSEETFEPEPDRMTPPPSPGPREMDRDEDGAENGEAVADVEADAGVDVDATQLELNEEDGTADPPEAADMEAPVDEVPAVDEDENDADLRASGFVIADTARPEADDEDDDEAEVEWDDNGLNLENYRAQREDDNRRIREEMRERVIEEEDDEMRMVNSASFSKRAKPGERWSKEETDFFFMVIGETGESYSLMKAYFPGRTVLQLKRKGLRENRENPEKMTAAILNRQPIDKAYLAKSAGYDDSRSWAREEALFAEAARDVQKLKGIESEIALEADDGQGMEDLVEGVGAGSEADLERMDEDKEEADKEEGGEEGEQEGEEEDGEDDE